MSALLHFNAGPGENIDLNVKIDFDRPFVGSDFDSVARHEFEQNVFKARRSSSKGACQSV